MNLEPSKSQSKLHGNNVRLIKRFNSKLNLSLFEQQIGKSDGNLMRTIPQLEEDKGYGPPTFRMPMKNNFLIHIAGIEQKLQKKQQLIQQLQRKISIQSNQYQKLRKNYDHIKQTIISLQQSNSQLILKNIHLQQENQMLSKKLSILDLQFKYKISITEQKTKKITTNGGSGKKQHQYKIKSVQPTTFIMTSNNETSTMENQLSKSESMLEIMNCSSLCQNPEKSLPSCSSSYKKHCRFKSFQTPQRITEQTEQKNQKHYQHIQNQIQSLKCEIYSLKSEIQSLKSQIYSLKKTITEYEQIQIHLREQIQTLKRKGLIDGDMIEKLTDQISLKDLLLDQKEQLLRKKISDSNNKQKQIVRLNKLLVQLQDSNRQIKKYYQKEIQNLQSKAIQLTLLGEEEKAKSQNDLLKMAEHITVLQDKSNSLHIQLNNMKIQSQQKIIQLLQSQTTINALQSEQQLLTSQIQSLHRYKIKVAELELIINEKEIIAKQKNKNLEELGLELEQKHHEKNKLAEEVEQLLTKLSQHETLIQQLMRQLQEKYSQIEDLQQSLQHKDLQMHRMTDELTQKISLTEKLSQQAQQKSCQMIQELTSNIKHTQQLAIKAQQIYRNELESFKRQCEKVVLNLSSQLYNSNNKITQLQQQNNKLNDHLINLNVQLEQRNKEVDTLKRQIEHHKQHFEQQKSTLHEYMQFQLRFLQQQFQHSTTTLASTHQFILLEKQAQFRSDLQSFHHENEYLINQLEQKMKQLEQRIKFMQEENKIKQEEIINLINQKNSIIQHKQMTIIEKDQLIYQLKKSTIKINHQA